ncbi:histone H3.v1-like [Carya illinoinensis]|uniref:histone H3.v1-like n=1 Tax=Carya illinoinensis TaxID=32201 RepID=UPI001C72129C|nr:histone H3.v1-like [Carya illinoinensis]
MEELLTQDANPIEMGSGGIMTWKSDDVYSKVMGLERPGRVRGLGFGSTPTKQTCQHSLSASNQENGISKEEFDKMRNELIDLRNLVNTFVHAQASGKNQNENEEEEKDEEEENAEEEEDQEEDEEAEENDEDND